MKLDNLKQQYKNSKLCNQSNMGNKITKETIPQGFSLQLALVDFIPVIFFGVNAIIFGVIIKSPLVIAGAAIACISGVIKCLWKIIAALKQKYV